MSKRFSFLNSHGLTFYRKSYLNNNNNNPNSNKSRTTTHQSYSNNYSPPLRKSKTFQPNIQEMKQVFDKYDTNKDGKISRDEYKAMARAIKGISNNTMMGNNNNMEGEVSRAFQVADKDGDGYVDFKEFMEVQNNKVKLKDIESAFVVFDSDGDGKISANEVMEVLRRMGEMYSLESCKKMIAGVDGDGDGLIDLDEFTLMMTRTMKLI